MVASGVSIDTAKRGFELVVIYREIVARILELATDVIVSLVEKLDETINLVPGLLAEASNRSEDDLRGNVGFEV